MNLFKRLTTSVSATLESAVGQLENHDAIVDATIKQTRQAVAKTQARINTLRQQQNTYQKRLSEAKEQQQLWTDRATAMAEIDQARALQCVARLNQAKADVNRLTHSIEQQRVLIDDVTHNLKKLQTKLEEMTQKHTLMRSRQTVADVNRAVASASQDENLNETFERWESVVLEHEIAVSDVYARDTLDVELTQQEDEAALLAQLAELTAAENNGNQEKNHE